MSVNITFDAANAAMRVQSATRKALLTAKSDIVDSCNKYCPTSAPSNGEGDLRKSAEIHSHVGITYDGAFLKVVYSTPYAKNMYYGIKMVDPVTHAVGFLNSDGNWRSRADVKKIPHPDKKEYTYHTDGTQKLWCEEARKQDGENWELIIQNALKGEL